jgi:hypothetical protein
VTPAARVAGFALLVAALGAGGAALGAALGPAAAEQPRPSGHGAAPAAVAGAHGGEEGRPAAASGLALAEGGYRLEVERTRLAAGRPEGFGVRILDRRGRAVREFEVEHERRMHLIVVRRDLTGVQHLHPRLERDGTFRTAVTLPEAGVWRVLADVRVAGRSLTLGRDVHVAGPYRPRALPAPSPVAAAGPYEVVLRAPAEPGDEDAVSFEVRRDGRPVTDLEPYLGARGHLVVLREGDLAVLHVHPEDPPTPGARVRFRVEFPTAGRYALVLQFRHEDRVHTAAFTREVTR